MPKKKATATRTRKTSTTKKTGATAKKASPSKKRGRKASVQGLLGSIGGTPTTTKKKSDKPIIDLGDSDESLNAYTLLCKKDDLKEIKKQIGELEDELLEMLDERRIAFNVANQKYVGSVHVHGSGEDEDGEPFDIGQAVFYVQNRYSGFNPEVPSNDEDLQAVYDGEATLRDVAIHSIIDSLGEHDSAFDEEDEDYDEDAAYDKASSMLDNRMDLSYNISLKEGALAVDADGNPLHPEVVKVLQEHLSEWLDKSVKMTPNESFHEKSNYDAKEMAIMQALTDAGLVKRSKPVLKAGSSPKAKKAKPTIAKRKKKA